MTGAELDGQLDMLALLDPPTGRKAAPRRPDPAEHAAYVHSHAARFQRAPYARQDEPGWVCPFCGEVQPNVYVLRINHGYDPAPPTGDTGHPWAGWGTECFAARLRRNHARYDALVAQLERDLDAGTATYPWGGGPCSAGCGQMLRNGDPIRRHGKGRKAGLAHAECPS